MEVLDPARMREADRQTIEQLQVPGLVLMENAGRLVAETILDQVDDAAQRELLVFAGIGNNGGDGFVCARHLRQRGVSVAVVLVGEQAALRGDAQTMLGAWIGPGGVLHLAPNEAALNTLRDDAVVTLDPTTIVIDALLGTGLSRPVEGVVARAIEWINTSGATVVAVDIPSGLDAGRSQPIGAAVHADLTVTFARPKPAQLLPPAEALCGEIVVVDIGIPARVIAGTKPDLFWATREMIAPLIPGRATDDHKGRFGHVLIVGGSTGKAGAAALAGWATLQSGAGLVTVAAPPGVRSEIASFAPEMMTADLPADAEGRVSVDAAATVLSLLADKEVLAIGPGLGQSASVTRCVETLLTRAKSTIVLDADGLNVFAGRLGRLAEHRATLIITPHPGEAARLLGSTVESIQADRLFAARRLAREVDALCVLKGHRTVIAAADGHALINSTGNPGMATGGMGDLLTGLIAGFLAQRMEPFAAASLAVYLHGLAGDIAIEADETMATLSATSLLSHFPAALRRLAGEDERGG